MNTEKQQPSTEDEAAAAFLKPQQGEWTGADQEALEARLSTDPPYASAYRRVKHVWGALGANAGSPELMRRREEAIAYARQVSGRRWLKAHRYARHRRYAVAAVLAVAAVVAGWQLGWFGGLDGRYHTAVDERRVVELDDHSRMSLDAATRVTVRYSDDARLIELKEGQAQFSVARDLTRPFKVRAGSNTIVALGTVFTVELIEGEVRVATLEGRVAVVPNQSAATTELSAGEALRVTRDGHRQMNAEADLEAATAWQNGKVIFRSERLGDAVHRLNRYSRVQIEISDTALAAEPISGVFETGNAQRFVDALQRSLPVAIEQSDEKTLRLRWQ